MAELTGEQLETNDKWTTCDGQEFKQLVRAGLFWLEKHQRIVNELNVFPVPDGDTGTNMLLTMRSAWRAIQDNEETDVSAVSKVFARGALMGARGNSGVILSQIWRGIGRTLENSAEFDAFTFGQALKTASDTAYGGVMKPVEGTILTVVRECAEEAVDAAQKSDDIRFVLRRALTRARQSLEKTPDLLPILKQAGVVDSGGQGLVYILEGMYRWMTGDMDESELDSGAAGDGSAAGGGHAPAQAFVVPDGNIDDHYDVQFILMGEGFDVDEVRNTIDAMGDSTVVVGDDTTIKVHVHVDDPGVPISYGVSLGEITDVVIENMQMQMDDIIMRGGVLEDASAAPIGVAAQAAKNKTVTVEAGQVAVVTVAPGAGLEHIFTNLGAAAVVDGGQTNNPSTEEIFAALDKLPTDKIILLPNNKNIILACEAARDLSENKEVVVVPTRTVPQGTSAMLALNPDGDLHAVSAEMAALADEVVTGQVTIATRTVELDGVSVAEGNVIGLIDGKLRTAGDSIARVLIAVLGKIDDIEDREIITLYYGADTTVDEAAAVAEDIEEHFPDLEVEVQNGGQAHYFYIFGVE